MVADIYLFGRTCNYVVYLNGVYELETYSQKNAIKLVKLLGATQINVKSEVV